MTYSALVILIHRILFQGMFFTKNVLLRRRLGMPSRGRNREAKLATGFFVLLILSSLLLSLLDAPFGSVDLVERSTAMGIALALLAINLIIGTASLVALGDSWRVGVLEDHQTDLVEGGIYRFSRNPYFVSYLIMFAAYTVILQSIVVLVLSVFGFAVIHAMVLKEERHLTLLHGDAYREYRKKVPRYFLIIST